jgi:homoserine dehydrogenase
MSHTQDIPLLFLGMGNVGSTLLQQILHTREVLASRAGLRLTPIALADVSGLVAEVDGLSDEALCAALNTVRAGNLLQSLPGARPLSETENLFRPDVIVADMTASPHTAPILQSALAAGCSVVLANKLPLSGPWSEAQPMLRHPRLRYEVTVGAGLPVIATLRYLLDTGDRVERIEGCLSGTLGYLCAQLEQSIPYSGAVAQARSLGYTEPDPREDLSGRDVARKALILGRTAGWPLESADFSVERLYDDALAGIPVDDFLAATPAEDSHYAARVAQALEYGKTMRYVARVTREGGEVGLVAVERGSALGALQGPGNYVALYSERYTEIPLVITGPGAGPEVTAAGVLGDIIALGRHSPV